MSGKDRDKEQGSELHRRLLAGDDLAPAEIASAYLESTIGRLAREFSGCEYGQIEDIVLVVFEQYFDKPSKFNPAKGSLPYYLYLSAKRDLLNWLTVRQRQPKVVHLSAPVGNERASPEYTIEVPDRVDLEEMVLERNSPVWQRIDDILPDPADRQMARWLIDGVKVYEPYAALLKITHLPVSEQRTIVNRNKERISKALKRHYDRRELDNHER